MEAPPLHHSGMEDEQTAGDGRLGHRGRALRNYSLNGGGIPRTDRREAQRISVEVETGKSDIKGNITWGLPGATSPR